jgi:hypothetical protein
VVFSPSFEQAKEAKHDRAVASPGDEGVEFLTWMLPDEGDTTGISFVLLVPDADAIGSVRWIPDIYTWTQKDKRLPPVRTEIQKAIELCWLEDEDGKVVLNLSAIPNGVGEVTFRRLHKIGGELTLLCDLTTDVKALTIGVNLHDIDSHGELVDSKFTWDDTYLNGNPWSDPARHIIIR